MNCSFCETPLGEGFLARHLCPSCGKPQPKRESETFFSALDAPERFSQNQSALQKSFYEASRALHPDRFTTSDAKSRELSLERMSFLNDAYRTLKSPAELRDYILDLHGAQPEAGARGQVPLEVAESWFDLQDSLAEDPDQAEGKILSFESELHDYRSRVEKKIGEIESRYDALSAASEGDSSVAARRGPLLKELSHEIQELSYLESLGRDVLRIKSRRVS